MQAKNHTTHRKSLAEHTTAYINLYMYIRSISWTLSAVLLGLSSVAHSQLTNPQFARDPKQTVDQDYTKKIHQYTTDPQLYLATCRLPACITKHTHTGKGARGRCWGAERFALCRGCLQIFSSPRLHHATRASCQYWPYRRGPRDDRRGPSLMRVFSQARRRTMSGLLN